MSLETEALLVACIVGLIVGWLAHVIAKNQAPLMDIMSAFLGALVGGYLSRAIEPLPTIPSLTIEVISALFAAIVLVFVINRVLLD
jgi:uncharacterized membrane protein YeaQ/YmgE (transglycosylase-associated protein family)